MPPIFRPVTIDASNLSLFGKAGVGLEVDGNQMQQPGPELTIYASNVTVRGIAFDGSGLGGVVVDGSATTGVGGAADVVLDHDFFGLNDADNANGDGQFGVRFQNGADHDTLSNSVVSANHGDGVDVTSGSNNVTLAQDSIGTDNTGLARVDDPGNPLGNTGYGVSVTGGASYVTLDGPAGTVLSTVSNNGLAGVYCGPGTTNSQVVNYTVDANGQSGVELDGSSYDSLSGDMIGVNAAGTSAYDTNGDNLGNAGSGVWVHDGAVCDTIGTPGGADVISGNHQWGVYISDAGTYFTTVQDDMIGTDDYYDNTNGDFAAW